MHKRIQASFAAVELILATSMFAVIVLWLPFFPEIIPAHYTGAIVDRMGSKYELFSLPLCELILVAIMAFSYWMVNNSRSENQSDKSGTLYLYVLNIFSILLFAGYDYMTIYFTAKAYRLVEPVANVNLYQVGALALSLIPMYASGYMPFSIVAALSKAKKERQGTLVAGRIKRSDIVLSVVKSPNFIAAAMLSIVGVLLLVFNYLYSNSYVNLAVTASVVVVFGTFAALYVYLRKKDAKQKSSDDTKTSAN